VEELPEQLQRAVQHQTKDEDEWEGIFAMHPMPLEVPQDFLLGRKRPLSPNEREYARHFLV